MLVYLCIKVKFSDGSSLGAGFLNQSGALMPFYELLWCTKKNKGAFVRNQKAFAT